MYTIKYKKGFITGYCNGGLYTAIIGSDKKGYKRKFCKTLIGAKRYITSQM